MGRTFGVDDGLVFSLYIGVSMATGEQHLDRPSDKDTSADGRNVNQTAQRGAQGAYTGGKYLAGGAGAVAGNAIGRIKGALLKGK